MRFETSSTWINYAESAHCPCCSWSVYHLGIKEGRGRGGGWLFNFLPIKKGEVILYPDLVTRLREGLLEPDGSWRFMVILLSKNEAFLRFLFVFPRQMATRRFKKCFCHLQSYWKMRRLQEQGWIEIRNVTDYSITLSFLAWYLQSFY